MNISHMQWWEGTVSQVKPAAPASKYPALLSNLESYLGAVLDVWCQLNVTDFFGDCLHNYTRKIIFILLLPPVNSKLVPRLPSALLPLGASESNSVT